MITLKVSKEDEIGERLDTFLTLKKVLPSRSQIRRLIDQEKIKVNGFVAKASHKIQENDHIQIEIPELEESLLVPQKLPLEVLYEDEDLIVIHKKAGEVVHPGAGNKKGTVVNALLYHCKNLSGIGGVLRPGVVHRLDKDTSGVMVFAKNDQTHRNLADQFKMRTVHRVYKALVFGKMGAPEGTYAQTIGRHPIQRKKMSTKSKHGKPALTRWKEIESFDQFTCVEAILATGRTHQIRVHFSDDGHPVVGDHTYGGLGRLKGVVDLNVRREIQGLHALLLTAVSLSFEHPATKKKISFQVPLPDYFEKLLKLLHEE